MTLAIFGNIRRQSDSTPAHKALKLVVNARSEDTPDHGWNRPAGRQRTSWISQIVRDTELTAADAWTVADDRSTWRALQPTASYAQQWVSECLRLVLGVFLRVYYGVKLRRKSSNSDHRINPSEPYDDVYIVVLFCILAVSCGEIHFM